MSKTRPFERFLPAFPLDAAAQAAHDAAQAAAVSAYQADPLVHKDISADPAAPGSLCHVDGFAFAPTFQSPLITVATELANRVGNRGVVATADIAPGTLLLVERARWPLHPRELSSLRDSRPELDFVQELVFDAPLDFARAALADLAPLYPRALVDLGERHCGFMRLAYGDVARAMIEGAPDGRLAALFPAEAAAVALAQSGGDGSGSGALEDVLLRLVVIVHMNAFPTGVSLHTAMLNHDCEPNAVKLALQAPAKAKTRKAILAKKAAAAAAAGASAGADEPVAAPLPWDSDFTPSFSEVRATRLIRAGEEVCISYMREGLGDCGRRARQAYLWRQFQFECTCALCEEEKGADTDVTAGGSSSLPAVSVLSLNALRLTEIYFNLPSMTRAEAEAALAERLAEGEDAEKAVLGEGDAAGAGAGAGAGAAEGIIDYECPEHVSPALYTLTQTLPLLRAAKALARSDKWPGVAAANADALLFPEVPLHARLAVERVYALLHVAGVAVCDIASGSGGAEAQMGKASLALLHAALRQHAPEALAIAMRVLPAPRAEDAPEPVAADAAEQPISQRALVVTLASLAAEGVCFALSRHAALHGNAPSPRAAQMLLELCKALQSALTAAPLAGNVLAEIPATRALFGDNRTDCGKFERLADKAAQRVYALYNKGAGVVLA